VTERISILRVPHYLPNGWDRYCCKRFTETSVRLAAEPFNGHCTACQGHLGAGRLPELPE
jgi:hypothetical protein